MVDRTDADHVGLRDPSPIARVLLVEDGDVDRLITRAVLEQARYRVETAANGLEALRVLRSGEPFDVILMDIDMPVMDGFEATATIRALDTPNGGDTPILGLSALRLDGSGTPAMNGFIAKPYEPRRLIEEIGRTLRERTRSIAAREASRVWNRERYDGVASRLGAAVVAKHLEAVRDTLVATRDMLLADPDDAKALAWEAHAIISPAGVLGFDDLIGVCREVRNIDATGGCRPMSLRLAAAVERVLAAIAADRYVTN